MPFLRRQPQLRLQVSQKSMAWPGHSSMSRSSAVCRPIVCALPAGRTYWRCCRSPASSIRGPGCASSRGLRAQLSRAGADRLGRPASGAVAAASKPDAGGVLHRRSHGVLPSPSGGRLSRYRDLRRRRLFNLAIAFRGLDDPATFPCARWCSRSTASSSSPPKRDAKTLRAAAATPSALAAGQPLFTALRAR